MVRIIVDSSFCFAGTYAICHSVAVKYRFLCTAFSNCRCSRLSCNFPLSVIPVFTSSSVLCMSLFYLSSFNLSVCVFVHCLWIVTFVLTSVSLNCFILHVMLSNLSVCIQFKFSIFSSLLSRIFISFSGFFVVMPFL